ncbi:helix-turn-helix domain containing protein [Aliarcobacter butzleri]|uniref:helix-turn-helix domain containing protein n=1 Tax=Aliarcobacter butzleri TaxID=28197 RepID=UPI0021B4AF10|nr:helix-turn-helix domain containing protein [Aliarcobacter butzleri]MCT7566039.1 helix-turn-helix domain containing protein [Aliarcobacter butzleri]MCT7573389.1 helix-turn-helix domain containing protein [Aliarcobacter butzleri]
MNIEILIAKLLDLYKIKTLNELAIRLDTTQSTISGWKARNAIGALTDTVANKDPDALKYIFSSKSEINNFQNSNNVVAQDFSNNSNGQHTQNIGNKSNIDDNILKLIDIMYNSALKNNKIDELKTDLSSLLPKYL